MSEYRAIIIRDGGLEELGDNDTLFSTMPLDTYDPGHLGVPIYDRSNHTGTQPHTTITGLGVAALLNVGTTPGTVAAGDHVHPRGTSRTKLFYFSNF